MKESTRYALFGLFMVLALAALGTLLVMVGETPAWLGGAEWELRIENVQQLSPISEGTEVFLNGVSVGRVERLDFRNAADPAAGVWIITKIKNVYTIPEGSTARVYAPTLGVGRGHVDIIPPNVRSPQPLARESAVIDGDMASALGDVISDDMIDSFHRMVENIGRFAEALTPVADDLHRLMEERTVSEVDAARATANLATVMERLDIVLRGFDQVVGDPKAQEDLKAVFANFRKASENLNVLMDELRQDIRRLTESVDQKLANLDERTAAFLAHAAPVLDRLDAIGSHLERAAADLSEGRGTAGLFLRDDRLYEELVETAQAIRLLAQTLQPFADRVAEKQALPVQQGPFRKDIPLSRRSAGAAE